MMVWEVTPMSEDSSLDNYLVYEERVFIEPLSVAPSVVAFFRLPSRLQKRRRN